MKFRIPISGKLAIIAILLSVSLKPLNAQQIKKTENLVIITIDGFRWNEVYNGADPDLIATPELIKQDSVVVNQKYWRNSYFERKILLIPFIWKTIGPWGQIYGNRYMLNNINCKNPYWISYPGYNEIFSGYADSAINSNDFGLNPNVTVLEYINKINAYQGRVASFTSWDAFPRIFNSERNKMYINSGPNQKDSLTIVKTKKALEELNLNSESVFERERLDAVTYNLAKDYVKTKHPKVLHIGFGDADEYAHVKQYDGYLDAIHQADSLIGDLWKFMNSDPYYKGKTTLIITVDHGRGKDKAWTEHNSKTDGSGDTWFAVMGPDIKPAGEVKSRIQIYQNQFAKTFAALLGVDFSSDKPIGDAIEFE